MRFYLLCCVAGLLLFLSANSTILLANQEDSLTWAENKLYESYQQMMSQNPFARHETASEFFHTFFTTLSQFESFDYPFNRLEKIGKIYSPDHRVRIYSWNIPVDMNENLYYGIIQYYSRLDKKYRTVMLNDSIQLGLNRVLVPWNETLYFKVVETKHAGQKYYTLLGFNFNTPLSNKKSIDIISIDDFDNLYFCENLFSIQNKPKTRMEFEYNEKVVMNLRYDEEKKIIVFDHLSPSKPSQTGKYEFYGPDFTYDGLKFEKGVWVLYSNIDITN